MQDFNDFDNEPTQEIPLLTMHQLVYGEGHAPVGPSRPTRDLGPARPYLRASESRIVRDHGPTMLLPVSDVSDGVPTVQGAEDTTPSGSL